MKELENLRALVYCSGLTTYQKALARREFEQLTNSQPSGKSAEEIFDDIFTPIDTDNIMRYKKDIINAMHVRRYISVADYEARNYQNINNLNTRTNDTRNTKTAIEYTCC